MIRILCIAAVPLFLLSACAQIEKVNVAKGNGSSSATLYCSKGRLTERDGNMVCNWEDSAKSACRSMNLGYVEKASITSGPKDAGRCETGDWLVMVTTN